MWCLVDYIFIIVFSFIFIEYCLLLVFVCIFNLRLCSLLFLMD